MSRFVLLAGLLFFLFTVQAQVFTESAWNRIDSNINKKNNLLNTSEDIGQLRQKFLLEKNYFAAARCYYYQVLIADQRTEDSLYFRNSAVFDSLLASAKDNAELQLAIHLLLAKRLSLFTIKSLRFSRQRYERKDIPVNYAGYTNDQLDSIARTHFEKAKTFGKNVHVDGTSDVLWLSSDPLIFLFRPALFDIVVSEQILYHRKNYYLFPPGNRQDALLHLSQDEFIREMDSLSGSDSTHFLPLKYYKEWLDHRQSDPGAYYFIESLARKFLYGIITRNQNDRKAEAGYEAYLLQITRSPYNTVRAHGVYQLCLLWNQQSARYFPSGKYEYDYRTGGYVIDKNFDTAYRYHAAKALTLFGQNKAMLDSFGYLKNILLEMEQKIKATDAGIVMEHYNLPNEPILAQLRFRNADKIHYSIIRMNNDFVISKYKFNNQLAAALRGLPEVAKGVFDLPATDDFNKHATHLKLEKLSPGSYVVLFSPLPLNDDAQAEYVFFKVSAIALLQENKRVFALDRKTGLPLAGAKARGNYQRDPKDTLGLKPLTIKSYIVNEQGFIDINDEKIRELEVYYNGDTAYTTISSTDDEDEPEDAYSKDEYDDLIEYYEENAMVEIFTDRSIYRPGQTVHFKAIFLTLNAKTGLPMVMNRQNMKGSFKSVYKKWLKQEEPELYLIDPFGKEVDTIKIRLNDYGSLSGSFAIPKTAAAGEWNIEPDYLEVGEKNEGVFQVEEYKRPSYEVSIEKPKKELLPGDSFAIKVKVKSFAGAALNNVRIDYTILRYGTMPVYDSVAGETIETSVNQDIADTAGYTNADGELEIVVDDPLLKKHSMDNDRKRDFTYRIDAETIDVTGESYEAEASVGVSSRPVSISIPLSSKCNRDEMKGVVVTAIDMNAGKVSKDIKVKVYRVNKDERLYSDRDLIEIDLWLYKKEELEKWFPLVDFNNATDTGTKKLIFEKTVNTGKNEKLEFDAGLFTAGNYFIEASCEGNGWTRGYSTKTFSIFDDKENKLPEPGWEFYHAPLNSFFPADTFRYRNGNSEAPVYSVYYVKYYSGKKKSRVKHYYETVKQDKGLNRWQWKIPDDATEQALLTHFYVLHNQLFRHTEKIFINDKLNAEPEIIVEQYRKKLSPGSKETFSVSIKTKNEHTAAELMTTLYDASLDKLEKHKWEKPMEEGTRRYLENYRNGSINSTTNSDNYYYYRRDYRETSFIQPSHSGPLWWLNPLDYAYDDQPAYAFSSNQPRALLAPSFGVPGSQNMFGVRGHSNYDMDGEDLLMGRVSGLSITPGLDEVVVVGYGTSKVSAKNLSASVIMIRGSRSLSAYSQPLIILDGVPYSGDLSKLDPNTITQALILKGADASAIYGARAAEGVLVLSTKGPIVFPEIPPDPPLPPRKNFNETAFFFPAIYADKDGYYRFTFTMPESVTEWNWKMLAHTKQLQFAYAERKLNTQLPLMVQPNMPRLLYQDDRIVLQSRISNLDSADATGKAICRIEDVVTGEDVTSLFLVKSQNDFSVAKKANVSSAFEIRVPKTQSNPIRMIVSVRSQNFADGEEHVIPVLTPKVLVKESLPFRFTKNMDTVLQAPALPPGAELYGTGVSILPKPQSALINALPYLANYSYDCAEQIFNKLRAHVTAYKIMRSDKEAQRAFERAQQTVEKLPEQKEQLPDEISEQAMPWLNLVNKTTRQQKQLLELLDTNRAAEKIDIHLQKLYKLQNSDGGLTWFEGGRSNDYISAYVLAGFGKLRKDSLLIPGKIFGKKYESLIEKLISYYDKRAWTGTYKTVYTDVLFFAYTRSFWKDIYPVNESRDSLQGVVRSGWDRADRLGLRYQAMLIISTLRYFDKNTDEYKKAIQQLNSIEQLAIRDDINGVRWKDIADSDDMTNSAEETLALLTEAFREAGRMQEVSAGIIKWLVNAKSEDHWSSTKATAAVVGMLLQEKGTATGVTQTISGTVNDRKFSVTDDLLNGKDFAFLNDNKMTPFALKKQNAEPAAGHVLWYYFSDGNLSKANKDIHLKKELFRYNAVSAKWEPLAKESPLKIADKIKVVLTIESSIALKYVFIDDKRAAAFEPKEHHSGYEYADGFGYYQSVRDAGMQFFSDFIPSGRAVISYEMIVAQEGEFASGPAALQCMYKPELNAYSNSTTVRTAK